MYILGVLLAIFSGLTNFFGQILQKKAILDVKKTKETVLMTDLIRKPVWLVGLALVVAVSAVCMLVAQVFIGPALLPGLVASGFIVMAIGSVKLLGEKLKAAEYIALGLLIAGIVLVSLSKLRVEFDLQRFTDNGFLIRISSMTVAMLALWHLMFFGGKKSKKYKAALMAIGASFPFIVSNIWTQPLAMSLLGAVKGDFSLLNVLTAVASIVLVAYTGIMGMVHFQKALAEGNASIIIPLNQMPQQIAPIVIFFFVYALPAPGLGSYFFMSGGIVLITVAGFMLGRRQAQIEKTITVSEAPAGGAELAEHECCCEDCHAEGCEVFSDEPAEVFDNVTNISDDTAIEEA
jgi:drug/metabolite transporter (DMT)-like permease